MDKQLIADLYAARDAAGGWENARGIHAWAMQHPETALYAYLEKDADKTLIEYQIAQIRGLVAKVRPLSADPADKKPVPVRAIHSVPAETPGERTYIDHEVLMSQRELLLVARIEAWKFCITRIANIGASGDAAVLQVMRAHLAALETELGGLAAA